jgi:hypothetical protein
LAYTETERHLCKMKVTYMVIINRLLPPTKAYALQRIVLLYKLVKINVQDHKQPLSWFTEFSSLFLSLLPFTRFCCFIQRCGSDISFLQVQLM